MSETNGPVCAHMHIENRREESEFGRVTREWWECRDCRTEFRAIAPQPQPNAVTDAETRVLGDLDDVLIYEPYGFCEEPADVDMTRTDAFRDAVRALLASLATLRGELDDSRRALAHHAIESDYRRIAIARLTAEREALLADKARLDILQDWLRGADYAYGELGEDQVLVFDLPAIRVSCDLRKTLDDARAPQGRTE